MQRSLFWLLDQYPDKGDSIASVQATALEHACLADRLGFSSLWIAEHHFSTLGTAPNPAVLLAAIAQRTEKLRIGPAVSVLPLRNPIHVAEDYALVDILSGGRLNMGVGTGSQPLEFAGLGVDFKTRRQLFDENLAVLQERWSAAASGETGPNAINVAPAQSPAPPIYVATLQEEGAHAVGLNGNSMLTLVIPGEADLGDVASRVEAHARALKEAGHPEGAAESVVVVLAHVADSAEEAKNVAAPALGKFVERMLNTPLPDPEGLYEYMLKRDLGLFGTVDHVAKQIERYAEIGVGHIAFISRFGGMAVDAAEQSLRRLAPAA